MLREEQIDIRRKRAAEEKFTIKNLGRNRVFSDYQITNPASGGQYRVSIRGFDVGDNTCECPDFRTNTLGTCKHIEAVLAALREETPPQLRRRKAAVTHPEIYLRYGEQLRLGLHLPPRPSPPMQTLADTFFDPQGLWRAGDHYQNLIEAVEKVPEQVTIFSDAMEFMEREIERREMAEREKELVAQLEMNELTLDLLNVPLYPYQTRGALFLAYRGRAILGDDMGLGKCIGSDTAMFVNGTLIRAEDVWARFAGRPRPDGEGEWADPTQPLRTNALALGSTEEMVPAKVLRLYRQRVREMVRQVRLDDGSEIVVTRRHKLLGRDGWTNELQPGAVVCVPARLEWEGSPSDPDLVTLLAWQVAEGHEQTDQATVRISQKNVGRLRALRRLARRVGERHGLRMNRLPIQRFPERVAALTISSRAYRAFLEKLGYQWGALSAGKRIPDFVMSADRESVRLFLRAYFTAEGSVCRGMRSVEIASASGWLMQQLACLLRRFGIWLRVRAEQKRPTNGSGIYRTYHVGVLGGNAVRRFLVEIGFDAPAKQRRLRRVCAYEANTNVEGIPASDVLEGTARATGLPLRHLAPNTMYFYGSQQLSRTSATAVVGAWDGILTGTAEAAYRQLPRSRWTERVLAAYTSLDRVTLRAARDRLHQLIRREVYYARVVEVRDIPYDGWVYDFEVEGHHNFVAASVLCHNTVQTLAAAELLARERGIERVLVVAPASVKYQWETEIRKYTNRPVQVIEGGNAERRNQYRQPTFYRLINYEIAVRDLDELNAWQPDLIVLDEAQRIKNWESKTSRAVKRLRSHYAVVLTGTPLENKLEELYSIVQFVDDRRLGPAFQFLSDHRVVDAEGKLQGYRNLDKIREKLAPILLRRTRAEVLSQLPARTDNTVYVEMAGAQRGPYAEHQSTLARLIAKKYLSEVDRRRILACLANLRMLCDSTFLLDKQTNVSPKLEEFEELLRDLLAAGPHKVVVFSQWELMLQKAAEVVEKLGAGYALLHGKVPGKDRRALLERFRDDDNCRVFLSTDAGGTGLNLQVADTVINLEVPWNPAVLEQRIARVHRMGQHRPVQVFNLVTRDSIEERVVRTLDKKRSLFENVFAGTDDEVLFGALGNQAFLESVRELLTEESAQPAPIALPSPAAEAAADVRQVLLQTGVQFLEALAAVIAASARNGTNGQATAPTLVTTDARTGQTVLQVPLPSPEVLRRGGAALQTILRAVAAPPPPNEVT